MTTLEKQEKRIKYTELKRGDVMHMNTAKSVKIVDYVTPVYTSPIMALKQCVTIKFTDGTGCTFPISTETVSIWE